MKKSEDPISGLTGIFINLGAEPRQAETMARQLWKRARQLAEKENIPPEECLERLLQKAVDGHFGKFSGQKVEENE